MSELYAREDEDFGSYEGALIAGKYRVESLLGRGGMGSVWLARYEELGLTVAVKLIKPELLDRGDSRQRFRIEAEAAMAIDSPHVVRVYDYGETEEGVPFMVMEYLEGESLADCITRRGAFDIEELARALRQASAALAIAHDKGIFHRDLKPDNLFLATNVHKLDAELPYAVKLVDFGIAKLQDQSFTVGGGLFSPTQTGMVVGTPSFMSPEQLTEGGAPDVLTEVWTLGVTAYTAATASLPFEGEVLGDVVLKVCAAPLPKPSRANPALPKGFDAWFERACARRRSERFQSVQEMSDALSELAFGPAEAPAPSVEPHYGLRKVTEISDSMMPPPPPGMSKRTAVLLGLVLGVSVMVGVAGFLAWRNSVDAMPAVTTPAP